MKKLLIIGIAALLAGFILQYWIYRRKFYRRNSSGNKAFSSFEKSVFTRFFEQILKWLSYIFIIIGVLYLWRNYRHSKINKVSASFISSENAFGSIKIELK